MRTCSIDGCDLKHLARGWCRGHYDSWKRNGDPLVATIGRKRAGSHRVDGEFEARFWAKVGRAGPNECWEWNGFRLNGYGRVALMLADGKKTSTGAHRVSWELLFGPIPDRLEIDHLCENRACVNTAHLEPVTHTENVRRTVERGRYVSANGRKTHCSQGHPYDEANTRIIGRRRYCKACNIERSAEWRRRNRRAA